MIWWRTLKHGDMVACGTDGEGDVVVVEIRLHSRSGRLLTPPAYLLHVVFDGECWSSIAAADKLRWGKVPAGEPRVIAHDLLPERAPAWPDPISTKTATDLHRVAVAGGWRGKGWPPPRPARHPMEQRGR